MSGSDAYELGRAQGRAGWVADLLDQGRRQNDEVTYSVETVRRMIDLLRTGPFEYERP